MRGFRAKYGAGILTGLMAAAVVCLAIGGYQAYSQTLQAQQELEQLKHLFGQLRPEFKEYVLKELQNLLELQDKADAYRRTK